MGLVQAYDSENIAGIPADAENLFCYIDLNAPNNAAQGRARFPKAIIKTITREHTAGADIIDCEAGLATPDTAASWAQAEHAAGRRPTIYCNKATWDAVKAAVAAHHMTGKVDYWIAAYPGIGAMLYTGTVAHQYLGHPGNSPGDYDVSVVDADWMHSTVPKPKPKVRPLTLITKHLLRKNARTQKRLNRRLGSRVKSKVPVNAAGQTELRAAVTAGQDLQSTVHDVLAL